MLAVPVQTQARTGPVALARNLTLRLTGPSFALGRLEWIYRWTPEAPG